MPADRTSWTISPPSVQCEALKLPLVFSDEECERMRRGHIPLDMDDKWFIFFEDGWLYFHRSWTGDCIYWVRLDGCPTGVRIAEAWASRDADRYRSFGAEAEARLIQQLIANRLLA